MARYTFNNSIVALQFITEAGIIEATIYTDASGVVVVEAIIEEG